LIINPFKPEYQKYLQIDLNKIPKKIIELSINRVMKFKKNPDYYVNLEERRYYLFLLVVPEFSIVSKLSKEFPCFKHFETNDT